MLFGVDHLHRTTDSREPGGEASLVGFEPRVQIRGLANVTRPVAATKDVHIEHPTTMPSSAPMGKVGTWWVPFDSCASRLRRVAHSLRTTIRLEWGALRLMRVTPAARRTFAQDYHSTGVGWLAMSEPTVRRRRTVGESNGAEERI